MKIRPLKPWLDKLAVEYVKQAVAECSATHRTCSRNVVIEAAAKALGISGATIYRMIGKTVHARERRATPAGESVYLMRDNSTGAHKIGWTKGKPEYREKTLQCEKPAIQLVGTWPGSRHLERLLHTRFQLFRMRGEWFNLGPAQLEELREIVEGQ